MEDETTVSLVKLVCKLCEGELDNVWYGPKGSMEILSMCTKCWNVEYLWEIG